MFVIFFDVEALEERRNNEEKSMRELGLYITNNRRGASYRDVIENGGACHSVEIAYNLLKWYNNDEDCISYLSLCSKMKLERYIQELEQ